MVRIQWLFVCLLCLVLGCAGGFYLASSEPLEADSEDEGTLRLSSELFQGYPFFYVEGTDWVIQVCSDGSLLQCHDYMRGTDEHLLKITGY